VFLLGYIRDIALSILRIIICIRVVEIQMVASWNCRLIYRFPWIISTSPLNQKSVWLAHFDIPIQYYRVIWCPMVDIRFYTNIPQFLCAPVQFGWSFDTAGTTHIGNIAALHLVSLVFGWYDYIGCIEDETFFSFALVNTRSSCFFNLGWIFDI